MPLPVSENTWDFSPVFNLIQSLKHDTTSKSDHSPKSLSKKLSQEQLGGVGLGDLNKVWDYLGVQRDVPQPTIPPFERSTAGQTANPDAYASDGALYYPPSSKTVKWRDEEEGLNLTDVQDSPPSHDGSHLTKNQRKKRNKKARKAAEQSGQLKKEHAKITKDDRGSADDELDKGPVSVRKRTEPQMHSGASSSMKENNMSRPDPPPDIGKSPQNSEPVQQLKQSVPATEAKIEASKPVEQVKQSILAIPQKSQTAAKSAAINVSDAVKAVQEAMSRLPPMSQSPGTTPQKSNQFQRGPKAAPVPATNVSVKDFSKSPSKPTQPSHQNVVASQSSRNNTPDQFAKQSISTQPHGKRAVPNAPLTPVRSLATNTTQGTSHKQWLTADPRAAHQQSLITLGLANNKRLQSQPVIVTPAAHAAKVSPPTAVAVTPMRRKGNNEIVPLAHQNSLDRNWSLLLKLMNNFQDDRKYLLSPLQLSINKPQPGGIHVFVDASNILIGFVDVLKRARGIPQWHHVPSVDLNFHALALLMERRRPVARRVLAGSTPEIAAFEEARQVGYETNILDKVYKAKELTERQKYFAQRDRDQRAGRGSNGYQSGGNESAGNGTNTSTPAATQALLTPTEAMAIAFGTSPSKLPSLPPPPPKWQEQAVDEILHLKILESVVDVDISPSAWADPAMPNTAPTMVLATGDAAEAEYSQGFMKMVQRALQKGWNVEVAAFGKSVSGLYRQMEGSKMLGARFKIIELDDYAEELFGETVDGA